MNETRCKTIEDLLDETRENLEDLTVFMPDGYKTVHPRDAIERLIAFLERMKEDNLRYRLDPSRK